MRKLILAAALVSATAIPAFAAGRGDATRGDAGSSINVDRTATAVARPNAQVSVPSLPATPSRPSAN